MKKVMVVITSRASYARIKSVLHNIRQHPALELVTLGAASLLLEKYGESYKVIEAEGIPLQERVYMVIEGANPTTMAKTVGVGIMELATIFDNHRPDIVISIADRFETLATAVAASYLNVAVAHVQGGEVTGSIDEKVRHAVTKLSSIHFVANPAAAKRVRLMGEDPRTIHVTGCPSIDLAAQVLSNPAMDNHFFEKYRGVGEKIDLQQDYLIVLQHSVTTEYELAYEQMWETLMAVQEFRLPTLLFWPNMDAGSDKISKAIRVYRERYHPDFIYFLKNVMPEDFLRLLINARAILGNSSVAIREGSFLGMPAVNVGSRQQGRERGANVIDTDHDSRQILRALRDVVANGRCPGQHLYGDGRAGQRIARLLAEEDIRVEKIFCSPGPEEL
jgi:UDP-hydrolysing UDP-N-acetyl-D-glucosamine 2-epimerase